MSLSCSKASLGHQPQGRHRDISLAPDSCPSFLVQIGPSFDGPCSGHPSSIPASLLTRPLYFSISCGDRVSLSRPGCPGSHSVGQAGFQLTRLPAWVVGLKVCATTAWMAGISFKVISVTHPVLIYPQIRTLDGGRSMSLWMPARGHLCHPGYLPGDTYTDSSVINVSFPAKYVPSLVFVSFLVLAWLLIST